MKYCNTDGCKNLVGNYVPRCEQCEIDDEPQEPRVGRLILAGEDWLSEDERQQLVEKIGETTGFRAEEATQMRIDVFREARADGK